MLIDLHNQIYLTQAIAPAAVSDNTAQVSAIIDTQGYSGLEFITNIGAIADADATFAVTIAEGDDSALADAAAVPDTFLIGTLAEAGFKFDSDTTGSKCRRIGYAGDKRYVRYTVTPSNNTGSAVFGVIAMLGSPRANPTDVNA